MTQNKDPQTSVPEPERDLAVDYALLRLGIAEDADARLLERLAQRADPKNRPFAQFLLARDRFASRMASFAQVKKAYRQKAMDLHPDRRGNDRKAEEELKTVNADFALIETMMEEAEAYFKTHPDKRANAYTNRRAENTPRHENPTHQGSGPSDTPPHATAQGTETARVYWAASIPRFIRQAKLNYLPAASVIGSHRHEQGTGVYLQMDVVMLSETEFRRARLFLGMENTGNPTLEMSRYTPAYVPTDAHKIELPPDEQDPWHAARSHFLEIFKLQRP